jgi:DNA-binding MarR family transcriptional regulator
MTSRPSPNPAHSRLASDLRLVIARIARKIRQSESAGLTPSQVSALVAVEQLGHARVSDIAVLESVSAPTVTRIVTNLEEAGLLSRADDPSDRRSSRVTLTAQGAAALHHMRTERTAYLQQRLAELTPAERSTLESALPILARIAGDSR